MADVARAADRPPGDPLVGDLLRDLGFPLPPREPDLFLPVDLLPLLLVLLHADDAMHELRELLELRPLVVRGLEGNADVDPALDRVSPAPAPPAGRFVASAAQL